MASSQRFSMSFLALYERDTSAINELCRTCLCKAGDDYISIGSTMPWSQRESCTAQRMIEQILNKELSKIKPQPHRICSKCIKKIKAIALFRNQCIESDDILIEFQKHIQNQPTDIEAKNLQNDFLFDMDEIMFPEQIDDKFLPVFDSDILKLESNVLDEIKRDLNPEPEEPITPPTPPVVAVAPVVVAPPTPPAPLAPPPLPPRRPRRSAKIDNKIQIPDKVKTNTVKVNGKRKPVTRKKPKKANKSNDVDMYVDQLLKTDIKASLKSLEKKYKKEKPEEDFTGLCEQCGLTFSSSNEYKKHIRTHEDKANLTFKFHCKFCSKGFNHRQTYNIHVNSHTREQTFICDMCGKDLATKNSLRIHFRYHLGIKNHVCPKCGYRFVTPRELRDHVEKKHAAVRAIACTYSDCSETFDSEYRLNLHIRVHETNYAFTCDVCGVATVSKFRLGVHKKIHTGEMIRHCPICQKRLAHDNALRRHIKNVHGDKKTARNGTVPKPKRTITLDGIILTTNP